MSRLTISLDDAIHQALKEASVRQGRPIGKIIIEEGLILRGIKPVSHARELVAQARAQSKLTEAEALDLSTTETRAHRAR
jgi:hypothetical protein